MRLLPIWSDHAGRVDAGRNTEPRRRRDRLGHDRQSMLLHDLSAYSPSRSSWSQAANRTPSSTALVPLQRKNYAWYSMPGVPSRRWNITPPPGGQRRSWRPGSCPKAQTVLTTIRLPSTTRTTGKVLALIKSGRSRTILQSTRSVPACYARLDRARPSGSSKAPWSKRPADWVNTRCNSA